MSKLRRAAAEGIVDRIRERYDLKPGEDGPNLRDHTHEELSEGSWSVDWEEGPYEWAYTTSEALSAPRYLLEPINSHVLGIFPL